MTFSICSAGLEQPVQQVADLRVLEKRRLRAEAFKIRKDNRILLTAADENYYPNCEPMPVKVYKKDPMHLKSLLKTNTEELMQILGDYVVKSVKVTDTADIIIEFENGVVMEFFVDYTWQNSEYFRFFKIDDSDNPHYVVKFYDGFIIIEMGKIA